MDLALSNILNVSVAQAPVGLGPFNVNNLAMFTDDVPNATFPANGYQIYKTAAAVSTDFGTTSKTAQMANAIFAQSPNLLAGNAYLVIFTLFANLAAVTEVQNLAFSAVPTAGDFTLSYAGATTAAIPYTAAAADVQAALRALAGLAGVTVTGTFGAGFVVTLTGVVGDVPAFGVPSDTLIDAGGNNVVITPSVTTHGVANASTEVLLAAITRTQNVVSYAGVIKTNAYVANELLNAANYVQTQNMMIFFPSNAQADVAPTTGIIWQMMNAGNFKTRSFLYLKGTYLDACLMAAGYAGRALSVDFSGSNTTTTMHLKNLATITADPSMTQAILQAAQVAGADVYASFGGVPKVFCSGANRFFDSVYNQLWAATDMMIEGFNSLASTQTKKPQTEEGVGAISKAIRLVCEQARSNGYVAPGTWNGDTFGNQQDFVRNIEERGYYIFSSPVALQAQTDRAARRAPLIQVALKEAGAIHSGNILVNINA